MENFFLKVQGFTIFGLYISFYGLIMAFSMLAGIVCAIYICKKKKINKNMPIDLALFALPFAIVGARIYYCIFNGVESFIDIFKIWEGGMAILGGVIGGFLGIVLCCVIKKYSLLEACDLAAPCLILGQAFGRIGCYFAGCCYGIETLNPALQFFPISVQINGIWHLSTFFYESALNFLAFIVLISFTFKTKTSGVVTAAYLISYGTIRAVLEAFRDVEESLMIAGTDIRISQLLSIILVFVGAILLSVVLIRKNKRAKN